MKKFLIFASGFVFGGILTIAYFSLKIANDNVSLVKNDSIAVQSDTDKIDSMVIVHDVGHFRLFYFNYPVNLDYVYGFMEDRDCHLVYGTLKPFMKEDPKNLEYFKKIDDNKLPIAGIRSINDGVLYNSDKNDKYMVLNTYDYQTNTYSDKRLYCIQKHKIDCWFIGVKE